jgi:HAD superfamily hydrolase (TIGR01509 family)
MNLNSHRIKTLLFDWDGTLVDSAQLGLIAFQKSFAAMGLEFHTPTYETSYSPNWYAMYEAMGLPQDKWETADTLWMQHYGEQSAAIIPGADRVLRDLQHKGYQLGIVSSGNNSRVLRELDHLVLRESFQVIVCNEQMVNKKPHPEGLEIAMQQLQRLPHECAYVGDSPEDIEMGRNAGMMTVGVRSSYPTSWKLEASTPDIYLTELAGLTAYF